MLDELVNVGFVNSKRLEESHRRKFQPIDLLILSAISSTLGANLYIALALRTATGTGSAVDQVHAVVGSTMFLITCTPHGKKKSLHAFNPYLLP